MWHRLARLPGTPHSIAAGFASGVSISFTPFLGLHILIACGIVYLVRGNYLAAVIGTVVGNPWTFPLFFALTGSVGSLMLGTDVAVEVPVWDWDAIFAGPVDYFSKFLPVVFPLIVGGLPIATAVWFLTYLVFKALVTRYRATRKERALVRADFQRPINDDSLAS
ncbi:MAG: DUF2062 domain-containing protein [Kordiimonadaceae bacterium]|nr:DUF2062 domain-containing protein [Kordiimonadaceae bacterium]